MPDVIQDPDFYYEVKDWKAGLNSNQPYYKAPFNSLVLATNGMINKRESLARRFTFSEQGFYNGVRAGTPGSIMWVGPVTSYTKRALVILYWSGTTGLLWTYDGTTWTANTGTYSSTFNDLTGMAWARASSGTEYIYVADPAGNAARFIVGAALVPETIDGTVNANFPQKCQFVINHMDRLWAAGRSDTKKDLLYYSKILIPETWDQTNNVISFGGQFGERITALNTFKDNMLLVGTDRAIYVLAVGTANNTLDWEVRVITRDYGILSNFTVVDTGDDVLFMDTYGDIRSLQRTIIESSAGVKPLPLSWRIKDQLPYSSSIYKSTAAYFNGLYFLFFANGTNTRKLFVYDKSVDSWIGGDWTFSYSGATVYPFFGLSTPVLGTVNTPPSSFSQFYLLCRDTAGSGNIHVLKLDDLDDLTNHSDTMPSSTSVVISPDIQTLPLDFGFPQQDKLLKWIELEMFPQSSTIGTSRNLTLQGKKDTETSWTSIGTVDYSGSSTYKKQKLDLKALGRGRHFMFRFTKTDTGPKFEILRAVIAGHVFEPRDN